MEEREITKIQVRKKIIPEESVAHIIQRAPGREILFTCETDYIYFLHLLKEVSKKHNFIVFCFVLLPNHFHLLIKFQKNNASLGIKNLCERYADYFNPKYERKGHVFYGAYRASLCRDESYVLASSVYIHINPLKAGLCQDLYSYRWSSLNLYIEKENPDTFIDYKFILNLLDDNILKAKEKYLNLINNAVKEKCLNLWKKKDELKLFRESIFSFLCKVLDKEKIKSDILLKDIELNETLLEVKNKRRIKDLKNKEVRRYIIQQMLSMGYDVRQISQRLGVSCRTVYREIGYNVTKEAMLV